MGPPKIKRALEFYPYQVRWIDDPAQLKLIAKSRKVGYSYTTGYEHVERRLTRPGYSIILSKGERLSKLFIEQSVVPHVRGLGVLANYYHDRLLAGTSITKNEVEFPGGGKIIALPANPDTARSYEGDVVLDEFAHHKDAAAIYEAITPATTRGFSIEVISDPFGQQGAFYELCLQAGLVNGIRAAGCKWSAP